MIHTGPFNQNCFVTQVMFPSGARVKIERNVWGLDVHVYTPRAVNPANEMGLCLDPKNQDVNTYGENLRY